MALTRVKTWVVGDTLTAADLNGEFNNILNNPISLVSPTTGVLTLGANLAAASFQITNLKLENLTTAPTAATTGRLFYNTGTTRLQYDNGAAIVNVATTADITLSLVPRRVNGLFVTISTSAATATCNALSFVHVTTDNVSAYSMHSTASFTIDPGAAGTSAAGGRDTAALISSTFVHLYMITTGSLSTTPAGIASAAAPPTGPAMPTNYSAWTYLGAYQYSSASTTFTQSGNIVGSKTLFGAPGIHASISVSALTSVPMTTGVPASALGVLLNARLLFGSTALGTGSQTINFLTGITSSASPANLGLTPLSLTSGDAGEIRGGTYTVPNRVLWAALDTTGNFSPTATLHLAGFINPNGDV